MAGDGAGTGPPVTHPRLLVSRDTAPPPRGSPSSSFPAQGGLSDMLPTSCPGGRKCLSRASWWGPTAWAHPSNYTHGSKQERLVPPDWEFGYIWVTQTLPESEVGWKMWGVVREFQRSEEDAPFVLKNTPPHSPADSWVDPIHQRSLVHYWVYFQNQRKDTSCWSLPSSSVM